MSTEIKTTYHENGKVKQVTPYLNGLRQGTVRRFNQKGILETEVDYNDDKICGKVKTYFEDGSLESVESYTDGLRNNDLVVYSRRGETVFSHNFDEITDSHRFHL
jgi:antitoxin component YwqK of YwqJK toxin-antitoxin module